MKNKIHIATVHWQSSYWIDIQLSYFKKFISHEYAVYASLNGIEASHNKKFYFAKNYAIKDHGTKLNMLADEIVANGKDEDWLVFIDGDAFPVADLVEFGKAHLSVSPLIAVQRLENLGDNQPHPSFCLTTIGFWKKINGDWQKGDMRWKNNKGNLINDVGGTLMRILDQNNINWLPLKRSNKTDLHPLMFGIYGNIVYHHGMGFRKPAARIDKYYSQDFKKKKKRFDFFSQILPRSINKFLFSPYKHIIKKNKKLNKKVLSWIEKDDYFFNKFQKKE